MEDYRVIKKLGSGGQGATHQALRKFDSKTVVIKLISCASIKEANDALKEAKVLQRLSHAGVVKYEDVFLDEVNDEMIPGKKKLGVCIVMELCEMGDLTAYLKDMRDVKRGVVSETVALAWIEEMSSALAYMHGENTLHRDLKPLNIFISRNSVKIGDFGLARQIVANRMSRVGTPCYLAPEVLNSERYAEEADIWGLGCIALEILSLKFLWESQGLLALKILQQPITANYMNRDYMPELRQCVADMLSNDARKRPSAQKILQFVRQLNAKAVPAYVPPPFAAKQQQRQQQQDKERAAPQQRERDAQHQREPPQQPAMQQQQQRRDDQQGGALGAGEAREGRGMGVGGMGGGGMGGGGMWQPGHAAPAGMRAAPDPQHRHKDKTTHVDGGEQSAAPPAIPPMPQQREQRGGAGGGGRGGGGRGGGGAGGVDEGMHADIQEEELAKDLRRLKLQHPGITREEVVERAMQDEALINKHVKEAAQAGGNTPGEQTGKRARFLAHVRKLTANVQEAVSTVLDGAKPLGAHAPAEQRPAYAPPPPYYPRDHKGIPVAMASAAHRDAQAQGFGGGQGQNGGTDEWVKVAREDEAPAAARAPPPAPPTRSPPPEPHPRANEASVGEGANTLTGNDRSDRMRRQFSQQELLDLKDKALAQVAKAERERENIECRAEGRVYQLPDGSTYKGDTKPWPSKDPHGKGTKERTTGEIYWGDFENGKYHGYGVVELPDSSIYKGQFKEGKYHGVGHIRMASGDEYLGQFQAGNYHGIGEYTDGKRGKKFAARFNKGKPEDRWDLSAPSVPPPGERAYI